MVALALATAGLHASAQPKAAPAASEAAAPVVKPATPGQKVLRYAFVAGETGFDPAHTVDLYSPIVPPHIFEAPYPVSLIPL